MKIFYDHLIFSLQRYGGVSKYFCELLKNIDKNKWYCPVLFSNNEYLESSDIIKQKDLFFHKNIKGKGRIMLELGKGYTVFSALKKKFDIYHQTHFDDFLLPFVKNKKIVTTFHDINFSRFPSKGFFWKNIVKQQQTIIDKADKVIAVSHSTRADMLNTFSIDESKIVVIHHGVDKEKKELKKERIIEQPYILYVGLRKDFKNFNNFAKAFSIVCKKNKNIELICTGKDFNKGEQAFLEENNILSKAKVIAASEQIMAMLYRDAEMFVYPSIFEGFGMPILEAMVYSCPVVLSNSSCFPEIAQDAGIYFDPYNPEDIADKILLVLEDSNLRNKIIKLGQERLAHFSWEKCAVEHMNVYKALLY